MKTLLTALLLSPLGVLYAADAPEPGATPNLVIIFTNDNGGGGNNAAVHTRNTAISRPYRRHKFDVLEGGERVPFIMRWPGRVPAGQTFDGIVSTVDALPTFAKAADASVPGNLDGVDLMPYIQGEKTGNPRESLCWQQRVWVRPNDPTDADPAAPATQRFFTTSPSAAAIGRPSSSTNPSTVPTTPAPGNSTTSVATPPS